MAITNYGTLKTAIAEWANRSDLGSNLADFVSLTEEMIYHGSKSPAYPVDPVRWVGMHTSDTPTISGSAFSLPVLWLETISLTASTGTLSWELEYLTPVKFAALALQSGEPMFYTVLDGVVKIAGTDSLTITHHYYQRSAAMSGDTDTTTLLTRSPALYLHGGLFQVGMFTRDDALTQRSFGMYVAAARALNNVGHRYAGPLMVRAG